MFSSPQYAPWEALQSILPLAKPFRMMTMYLVLGLPPSDPGKL